MFYVWMIVLGLTADGGCRLALDDVGLRFDLPAPWVTTAETGPFAALGERPPRDGLAMVSRAALSLAEAETRYLDKMNEAFTSHEVLAKEAVRLGAVDTRCILLAGRRGDTALRHLTYLFEGFGEVFSLTFAVRENRFAELEGELRAAAATLVFTGPPHAAETAAFAKGVRAQTPDVAALADLLARGADPNAKNGEGETPLIHAVMTRNGPLVKWLLDQGVDPEHPNNGARLLYLAASPPIRALFQQRRAESEGKPVEKSDGPKGLAIEWRSPESQLLAGITNGRIDYVREALAKGADTTALDPNYKLPAPQLARRLTEEYRELELDPGDLPAIAELLAAQTAEAPAP